MHRIDLALEQKKGVNESFDLIRYACSITDLGWGYMPFSVRRVSYH